MNTFEFDLDKHQHWKEASCLVLKRDIKDFWANQYTGAFHCDSEIITANTCRWKAICIMNGILNNCRDMDSKDFSTLYGDDCITNQKAT